MLMNETGFEGAQPPIDGYAPGGFRVRGRFVDGPILLTPDGLAAWSGAPAGGGGAAGLTESALAALLALAGRVDVLMIGMGGVFGLPEPALLERLHRAGLGVEPMSTPSACRSYNVALSEQRRVAAALIPV